MVSSGSNCGGGGGGVGAEVESTWVISHLHFPQLPQLGYYEGLFHFSSTCAVT